MSYAKRATVGTLKRKLDKLFSLYIRKKYADYRGFVRCFTCGKVEKIGGVDSIQCGHYISRAFNSLRYSEKNCHPQCRACNIFKHGNMDEYALKLIEKYERVRKNVQYYEEFQTKDAEILIVTYGTSSRVTRTAVRNLESMA